MDFREREVEITDGGGTGGGSGCESASGEVSQRPRNDASVTGSGEEEAEGNRKVKKKDTRRRRNLHRPDPVTEAYSDLSEERRKNSQAISRSLGKYKKETDYEIEEYRLLLPR